MIWDRKKFFVSEYPIESVQYAPLTIMYPAHIYLFKVNNTNRKRCEICSKLTIKTPERRQWRHSGVFIVNFEHISPLFLVFLLLTLNKRMLAGLYECFCKMQKNNGIENYVTFSLDSIYSICFIAICVLYYMQFSVPW